MTTQDTTLLVRWQRDQDAEAFATLVYGTCRRMLGDPHDAQDATDKLARIFQKAGAPQNYSSVYFDGPHEFNATMQEKAFTWLDEKLA